MSEIKKCTRCGGVKPISSFYAHKGGGCDTYCKNCRCEYNKEKRRESPVSFSEFYRLAHLAHLDKKTGEKIKRCSSCEQLKKVEFFHKRNHTTADGYRGHCKLCHNKSIASWRNKNPDKARMYQQMAKKANPERYSEYIKKSYRKHQEKRRQQRRAYRITHLELENSRQREYQKKIKLQKAADQFFLISAASQSISKYAKTITR